MSDQNALRKKRKQWTNSNQAKRRRKSEENAY